MPEVGLSKYKKAEITVESKTDYFIVFNDDTTRRITKEQADALMQASGTNAKFIQIEGMLINFSNIARVIPVSEYYDQFPDERPPATATFPTDPTDTGVGYRRTIYSSEKHLRGALKIWKEQLASPDYVRVTGGLPILIADGEAKLLKLIREKRKEITLEAKISLTNAEEEDRRKRIEKLKAKKKTMF